MFHLTGVLFAGLSDKLNYLDFGSGSILIQLLVAAALGAAIAVRASWGKIKGWFGIKPKAEDDADDESK